ncbi:protein of unknown function [Chitinophaga jiangningensis]|uniref:Zinc-dependent metalloprotease n=1 Tax=Chitinophaga jiangningensis TaxID=1419482 RepID=A0A1M6V9C0_9BACT|nr:zinc-dependent metalloprotease [Chitinophaga jiangningensis]SHK78072.1 protein of unknown function [Chitinophaga jiangningensis]
MKRYAYIPLVTLVASCAVFKGGNKKKQKAAATAAAAAKPAAPEVKPNKNGVLPFDKVVTSTLIKKAGMFTLYKTASLDTLYMEIPDSLLGRDFMVVNRLKKSPAGSGVFAGESLDENTVFFEKGPNETLKMRLNLVIADADTTDVIYKAVVQSNNAPVAASLPIKAYGKDSASYIIDLGKYLKEASAISNSVEGSNLSRVVMGKTFKDIEVLSSESYPENLEIVTRKNGNSKPTQTQTMGAPVSLESSTSIVLLPKAPMQRRFTDFRVGYFADYLTEFGDNQQRAERRDFIVRWRLEPKPEDVEKYKSGELVEPAKPIVYYIDPATPKQWRKYLIQGVNDWQVAFEKAGFKNAIMAKEWPENDSTMSMDDVRYSFINYFPSPVANAYGPNVHDPRSGEIIQTHIGWYHNVMSLVRNWYMIQGAPNDPMARKPKFDEELMGQLIRFVSSHEVGHTLGLRHNFGSSAMTPVDSLRNIAYLQKHGHTASIMDYARFNYVAQPEDNIPQELLFPRIGEYDQWAIEWGYKLIYAPTAAKDKEILDKVVTKRLNENPRLWFGDGETRQDDARCQTEDLGDNAAKASALGIENLKRVVANLPEWTREEAGLNKTLDEIYKEVKGQYERYMNHVIRYVGTTNYTARPEGDSRAAYAPVPRQLQIDAVDFFNKQLFATPKWILDPKVTSMVGEPAIKDYVQDMQKKVLASLYGAKRLNFMLNNERRFGKDAMSVEEFIAMVHEGIWGNMKGDAYRRNLQKVYLNAVNNILGSAASDDTETDISSLVRLDVVKIQSQVKQAMSSNNDAITKAHLADINVRIEKILSKK